MRAPVHLVKPHVLFFKLESIGGGGLGVRPHSTCNSVEAVDVAAERQTVARWKRWEIGGSFCKGREDMWVKAGTMEYIAGQLHM